MTISNRFYSLEFIPIRTIDKLSTDDLPISSIMGIAHDITDQHLAKEAAVNASKQKTDFLGKLSHEIRTPMVLFLFKKLITRMELLDFLSY